MKRITLVLLLISVPSLLALAEATSFHAHNATNGSITSDGTRRDYLIYVPSRYDPKKPAPLVISMHGAGLWAAAQKDMSEWNRVADKHGFLVVYPNGEGGGGPRIFELRDVRFIAELLDSLQARYNIDRTRIYANGLSNGGGMSFILSCTLADRIAAAGLVASAQTLPFEWCPDGRPVPVIAFHGTADPDTPYHGGSSWVWSGRFPDIPTFMRKWARRNRCAVEGADTIVAKSVLRHTYTHCSRDADVVFYTLVGGGHTWPGGGKMPEWFTGPTNRDIDASTVMWQFFTEHPLH